MEMNFAGMAFTENLKRNPDILDHITNIEKLSKQLADSAKERAELNAKNAAYFAAKPGEARKLYNQLSKELFDAQQWAKHAEIYANEWAGKVKLFEQRITDLLKQKKVALEAGNLVLERRLENSIQLLETELLDAKKEFNRAKIQSGNAGRALKSFAGHQRIAELKAELGIA